MWWYCSFFFFLAIVSFSISEAIVFCFFFDRLGDVVFVHYDVYICTTMSYSRLRRNILDYGVLWCATMYMSLPRGITLYFDALLCTATSYSVSRRTILFNNVLFCTATYKFILRPTTCVLRRNNLHCNVLLFSWDVLFCTTTCYFAPRRATL